MKNIKTFESFLYEAKDSEYVNQDETFAARKIGSGLRPGEYKLTQDVEAWVLNTGDTQKSNSFIGTANVPKVKLEKVKLKKGTMVERSGHGEEVYLEGNREKPMWLVDPRIFDDHWGNIKDSDYEEVKKIATIVKR